MKASSHPYVIAVYRQYYLEIEKINEAIFKKWDEEESKESPPAESDWGSEDEKEDEGERSGDQDQWGDDDCEDEAVFCHDGLSLRGSDSFSEPRV